MSDLLVEPLARLLAAEAGPGVLAGIGRGDWPAGLWRQVQALGLPLALVAEEAGGAGLSWAEVVALWQELGRHGAPVPLGEAMLAQALLAAAGLPAPEGMLALGQCAAAWGRMASHLLRWENGRLALHAAGGWEAGANAAGEPRDDLTPAALLAEGPLPEAWAGEAPELALALLRAAQLTGAAEAALALAVDWANTRHQFGRPIGRFQAVQHMLAQLAAEVALAQAAVAGAAQAADARGLAGAAFEIACAKVMAGEAGREAAARSHQVLGAIGMTAEHGLHHLTRRLLAWREEGGSERLWAARIGRAALERGGARLWADLTARDVT
ncbi:MAG: acyl-CoA dehydrogenase family protein [Rhodovarius sp.]|nr:acyl-CoA dehydrogenase family protein [Rhodovarius sp.]